MSIIKMVVDIAIVLPLDAVLQVVVTISELVGILFGELGTIVGIVNAVDQQFAHIINVVGIMELIVKCYLEKQLHIIHHQLLSSQVQVVT